jgi:host factor-I protein
MCFSVRIGGRPATPRQREPGDIMTSEDTQNQDGFLEEARRQRTPLTLFLKTGIRLQGIIQAHDRFCVLLVRGDQSQLVYKHAISTIAPYSPADDRPPREPRERTPTVVVERRTPFRGRMT